MSQAAQTRFLGLSLKELTALAEGWGQPAYRGRQLFEAIYRQRIGVAEKISTLPADFRIFLSQNGFDAEMPRIEKRFVSSDGTVRYLIGFSDGETVETVWMPEGDGGEAGDGWENAANENGASALNWKRATICVSSQVGCAVNCQFCLTALLGVKRNLEAGEIVGQICAVLNDQKVTLSNDRINLVFMGMGEPLLNYENFVKAIQLIVDGVGIAEKRMTVSTAGIVPRIYDLGAERIRPKLAISLNASNDSLRTQIMPINRKWNLDQLISAARDYPLRKQEMLTFEYVLLDGINDSYNNSHEVVELLRGLRAKVNLIAFNPGPGVEFKTPAQKRVLEFQNSLLASGLPAFIRRPRGRDIYAACGQLKRTVELAAVS